VPQGVGVRLPSAALQKPPVKTGGFFVCFRQSNRRRNVWQFASKDPQDLSLQPPPSAAPS